MYVCVREGESINAAMLPYRTSFLMRSHTGKIRLICHRCQRCRDYAHPRCSCVDVNAHPRSGPGLVALSFIGLTHNTHQPTDCANQPRAALVLTDSDYHKLVHLVAVSIAVESSQNLVTLEKIFLSLQSRMTIIRGCKRLFAALHRTVGSYIAKNRLHPYHI